MTWKMEFEEYGGYDCMSAAYVITNKDDRDLIVLDLASFDIPYGPDGEWEILHREWPEARALGQRVVDFLNATEQ